MSKWRRRLYGYTGLAILFGLWTPLLWLTSDVRAHYKMEMFEITRADPFVIFIYVVLIVATLLAQLGFMLIAQDLGKYERMLEPAENE